MNAFRVREEMAKLAEQRSLDLSTFREQLLSGLASTGVALPLVDMVMDTYRHAWNMGASRGAELIRDVCTEEFAEIVDRLQSGDEER